MNYVRTSHYPPSQEFLDLCDQYGIYVEEETAVCFQYTHAKPENFQRNCSEWYVGPFAEMVEHDRSHPSVLIWSLGNESVWHGDFQEEYDYIKETDISRPVKFSYPDRKAFDNLTPCYDIFSKHYIEFDAEMSVSEKPTIHDEYVHVACYNLGEINHDVNIRNFWGESLYKAWENIVRSDGALGGAIWAGVDDVFQIPENTHESHQSHSNGSAAGYGEWGNYTDIWRREKPEFWVTKKAYSPIRIKEDILPLQMPNHNMQIPIANWFNHTNFSEVEFHWNIDQTSGIVNDMELLPYEEGILVIPYTSWNEESILSIMCYLKSDGENVIDSFKLRLKAPLVDLEVSIKDSIFQVVEEDTRVKFYTDKLTIVFDKSKGMLMEAIYENVSLITGGPYIVLDGIILDEWEMKKSGFNYRLEPQKVTVKIEGNYGENVPIDYVFELYNDGTVNVSFSSASQLNKVVKAGICFDIPLDVNRISWNRKGFFTDYTENHIGRLSGTALKLRSNHSLKPDVYRQEPEWEWKDDMRNFYMFQKDSLEDGIVTNDFNTLRENIHDFTVELEDTNQKITVLSQATDSAKINIEYVDGLKVDDICKSIYYSENQWESGADLICYKGTYHRSKTPDAYVEYKFVETVSKS